MKQGALVYDRLGTKSVSVSGGQYHSFHGKFRILVKGNSPAQPVRGDHAILDSFAEPA